MDNPDALALIKRIGEVSEAVAIQAGVGASETAGMIVSVLYKRPELIERFLKDGYGLFIDEGLSCDDGALSVMGMNGTVNSPETLRLARQARRILLDAGATPGKGNRHG